MITRVQSLHGILIMVLACVLAVSGNVAGTVFLSAVMITNMLMRIYDLIEYEARRR